MALAAATAVLAATPSTAVAVAPGGRQARGAVADEVVAPQLGPRTVRALDGIVRTAMAASATPGMAAGVWIPGRALYTRALGVADIRTGRPLGLDDHVRIASITKTFTATAVLQLVDRGKLRLDDHLADFVGGVPNGRRITVRQLLDMSAGVFDFTTDARFVRQFNRNPEMAFGARQFLAILARHRPSFPPGTAVRYSDSNYYLLGMIVERVAHRRLEAVITDWILRPLGLTHTSFPTTAAIPEPYSRGYFPSAGDRPLRDVTAVNPAVAWAAGAMISTLGDLHIWARALARGSLLSPRLQRQRLKFLPFPHQVLDVGYGLGILHLGDFVGHNGAIYGFSSAMFYLPEADATIVVLGNLSTNATTIATSVFFGLAEYLFPRQFPAG